MDVINNSNLAPEVVQLIDKLASLSTLFQAIGGLILLYIIFNTINLIINLKRKKELESIKAMIKGLEKEIIGKKRRKIKKKK